MASRDSQFQVMVLYIFLRLSYHNDNINLSHDHLGGPSLHAFHLIHINFSILYHLQYNCIIYNITKKKLGELWLTVRDY